MDRGIYIAGRWSEGIESRRFTVENPADGSTIAELPDAGRADAARAIAAAAAAQDSWRATPVGERARLLRRACASLIERTDELAALITAESGKPRAEARGEVDYGAQFLEWFADQATQALHGEHYADPAGKLRILTARRPVGPAYLITPWNFPLAMITRKVAPALATGCTCVLKPAPATPLTAVRFVELLAEAGLPDGVVNLITSTRAGEVTEGVLASDALRKISFTGSTAVGRDLLRLAAGRVVKTSMELGGNAPLLVFDDADPADIAEVMVAKLRNGGQSCIGANRILVHRAVESEFTSALVKSFGQVQVGDGSDPGTDLGPLIHAQAARNVDRLVERALRDGAKLAFRGTVPPTSAAYYPPTVLTGVRRSHVIFRTEIFGPVATLTTFDSEREAVELANDTEYGLASYLFTSDIARALRVAERLDFGIVGVNRGFVSSAAAPFGGMKASGLGREGGLRGLEEFLETQYLSF